MLGDTSRNWYADKGISSLSIPKDYQIVELHMDSNPSASPHGGHVIIYSGYSPDTYEGMDIGLLNVDLLQMQEM